MTAWEKKISGAFMARSVAASKKTGADAAGQRVIRLRSSALFPDFDAAQPDEKEAYLEAAEALERKGLLCLKWERRSKGERLKTLVCENVEKLFKEAGRKSPGAEAEKIRAMIKKKLPGLEALVSGAKKNAVNSGPLSEPEKILSFLRYLAEDFSAADLRHRRDLDAPADFIGLMETILDSSKLRNISTRALSIDFYSDSKRLECLLNFAVPFLSRARKEGVPVPDLSFLERSFPETMIAGKLIFEFIKKKRESRPPMVNAAGLILGLPLSSAMEIHNIKTIARKKSPSVLTIENKETFYALAASVGQSASYDCYLYTSGYPSRVVAAIIKLLSASGFCFYHAGDLDPDGILILQNIQEIAEKPVVPLRMDAATFDRYLPWARPVAKTIHQMTLIRDNIRTIPELAGLIERIAETRRGVEQEIIDYRDEAPPAPIC